MYPISRRPEDQHSGYVLLAPSMMATAPFNGVVSDVRRHESLIAEMQRLRGRIAVLEGAVAPQSLTPDGRHVSEADYRAWHLLRMNSDGSVAGCVRMLAHARGVRYEDLLLSSGHLATSETHAGAVRSAVEKQILKAERTGVPVVEVGGWVMTEQRRCSMESVRLALGVWAWAEVLGGAIGFATATAKNRSSCILGRIGGQPLCHDGSPLPEYYEPEYGCRMQILRFDTGTYQARFASLVRGLCRDLAAAPVVASERFAVPALSVTGFAGLCANRELAAVAV